MCVTSAAMPSEETLRDTGRRLLTTDAALAAALRAQNVTVRMLRTCVALELRIEGGEATLKQAGTKELFGSLLLEAAEALRTADGADAGAADIPSALPSACATADGGVIGNGRSKVPEAPSVSPAAGGGGVEPPPADTAAAATAIAAAAEGAHGRVVTALIEAQRSLFEGQFAALHSSLALHVDLVGVDPTTDRPADIRFRQQRVSAAAAAAVAARGGSAGEEGKDEENEAEMAYEPPAAPPPPVEEECYRAVKPAQPEGIETRLANMLGERGGLAEDAPVEVFVALMVNASTIDNRALLLAALEATASNAVLGRVVRLGALKVGVCIYIDNACAPPHARARASAACARACLYMCACACNHSSRLR